MLILIAPTLNRHEFADVVKTRMQKQVIHPGKEPKVRFAFANLDLCRSSLSTFICTVLNDVGLQYKSLFQSCVVIAKEEGTAALWKGITPRLMRIMPGQAITFMTYEAVTTQMDKFAIFD